MTLEQKARFAIDCMPNLVGTPGTSAYNRSNESVAGWYNAYFKTIRTLLEQAAAGKVMVPREPTEAMVKAAFDADLDIYWGYGADGPGSPRDVWKAMIGETNDRD